MIGSGFGGLALAIRLQSAGIDTLILEQRDKAGGRAYVYHDQGFTFDAGPTVITDPACLQELWGLSGADMAADVELLPISPFYRLFWPDGSTFDYLNDDTRLTEQIEALEPADVEGGAHGRGACGVACGAASWVRGALWAALRRASASSSLRLSSSKAARL